MTNLPYLKEWQWRNCRREAVDEIYEMPQTRKVYSEEIKKRAVVQIDGLRV